MKEAGAVCLYVENTLVCTIVKAKNGKLSFPGGKLESGETSWEAAIREFKEETGLEIYIDPVETPSYINYDDNGVLVTTWFVTKFSGKQKSSPEGEIVWAYPSSLIGPQAGHPEYNRYALEYFQIIKRT